MTEGLRLAHLCDLKVELAAPVELGLSPRGRRRMIPIVGGTVTGTRLSGRILNLGADWQTVFADGSAELDTRYAMETHDGAMIDIRNFGYRHGPPDVLDALGRGENVDPTRYYMRTQPRFETGDARYAWLNRTIFVGSGAREADCVKIAFYEVL
ncbi:DUF3237 domain-containing protein [Mesorhizobium sp. YIM 152430]|uniref:DUF3237 domain-containing protein n=1 Tax=Mesorhizobium sp. YIM 152430 TaxID=3031761 RepID=UPI0023DC5782|nr:DUF3237 domain-containing protein [Mesorhizobium sp. YIM 152430]MDF1601684.1 DUF3237 domain-containing protein [Mesorhizobium sp. YIM 152430]